MAKPKRKPGKRITAKAVQAKENVPVVLPQVEIKPERDEDGVDDEMLTPKQRAFALAYVGAAGFNATKAAEMAGYRAENYDSLKATAWENLTKPYLAQFISRLIAEKVATPEWAENKLKALAQSDMSNFVSIDPETGKTFLDMKKAQAVGALGQAREYTEERTEVPGTPMVTVKAKLKLHDPTPSLRTLLQMQGKLVEKVQMSGNVTHVHKCQDEVKKLLADRESTQLANTLARRMASNASGNGESSN